MTYYTLTLDALAASTLDELAAMEMGRPPLAMPWHSVAVGMEVMDGSAENIGEWNFNDFSEVS